MKTQKKPFFLSRVDVQVSLLVALITLSSTWISSLIYHSITYQIILLHFEERVYALYQAVERDLDHEIFYTIHSPYDMESTAYQDAHALLLHLCDVTGVKDLYTAKETVHGKLVYVVDGRDPTGEEFHKPGDSVNQEVTEEMARALQGEYFIPDSVLHTQWGAIFIAYFPIYDEKGDVLGVLGVEFEAEEIAQAYDSLQNLSPYLVILFTLVASLWSFVAFRRISNPFYMDLATTDAPTHLKNRNAFEVDLNNFITRTDSTKIGLIVVDLNGLKEVNDQFGHQWGDDYIKLVADCITEIRTPSMIGYRVGGDEFVIIVQDATLEILDKFVYECTGMVGNQSIYPDIPSSISCGSAIFDPNLDKTLKDTLERADIAMYQEKRLHKKKRD